MRGGKSDSRKKVQKKKGIEQEDHEGHKAESLTEADEGLSIDQCPAKTSRLTIVAFF